MKGAWTDVLHGRSRRNRAYAKHKLTFFERYLPAAFKAVRKKRSRYYVDLFAGPGVWHDRFGNRHLGSPLAALELSTAAGPGRGFTEAFFVNRDEEDHEALVSRIELMVDRGLTDLDRARIHLIHGDANTELPGVLGRIHRKAWVFAYADIENPSQWPWSTVESLRSQGHESIDLYVLFPLHMALQRILGYTVQHPEALTRFYGCDDWREIAERRKTSAQRRAFLREMELLYARRLEELGWTHVQRQRRIADVGARHLYYMLFATANPVARALSEWEAVVGGDERHRGQFGLEL